MADYVTLLGAEQVQSAAHTMQAAAVDMTRAAGTIDWALNRNQQFMDDWLMRFEQALAKLPLTTEAEAPK
jgi:hypothetical protein